VILGPTASGKTKLACLLAYHLNGEIISADSRQVYKHLNIGTGKDLEEYVVNGRSIPYHLIDIRELGEHFFLHEFMELCRDAFENIRSRNKLPIICGGTGLYLDSLRKDFSYTQIKENDELRPQLKTFSKEQLLARLKTYPSEFTEHVDLNSTKRLIRAIEVAEYLKQNPGTITKKENPYRPFYIGVDVPIEERKEKITKRLKQRLDKGLIEETEKLLSSGITPERLEFLGLEYKFTSQFVLGKITRDELFSLLQTAIFQFSKRQMTWFRKMEREGVEIHWVKPIQTIEEIIQIIPKTLF
jgi:tRNA dimethylallyltransferase